MASLNESAKLYAKKPTVAESHMKYAKLPESKLKDLLYGINDIWKKR